tara:strand:- start:51 stop:731 length:681 start_codon:yes stop_codon:yes gene_type:complete
MSLTYFFEIFGGVSAVVLGITGGIWKCCRSHEFKYDYEKEKKYTTSVLKHSWEHKGDKFPENISFGRNYNRGVFAKKKEGNWNINIKQGFGSVYLYLDIDQCPSWEYNNKHHYLRINIKNVVKDMKIEFQQKFWGDDYESGGHDTIRQDINNSGVHIFNKKCLITEDPNSVVKREQLGVHITGHIKDIENVIINEAYYGEKWSFYRLFCCKKHINTLLCRKKKKEN